MKFAAGMHPAANRGPVFDCGHARGVKARCDGLYELTGCPVCAVDCPHEPCAAAAGQVCRTPAGYFSMTHLVRIEAAGVTRRRVADREVSPELASAVDLFQDAMDTWRAINDSTRRNTGHRKALVLDDRAVVEALLHAGWTPPEGQH